jgi:hypothetical protein
METPTPTELRTVRVKFVATASPRSRITVRVRREVENRTFGKMREAARANKTSKKEGVWEDPCTARQDVPFSRVETKAGVSFSKEAFDGGARPNRFLSD